MNQSKRSAIPPSLPNILTVFRIFLTFGFTFFLLQSGYVSKLTAFFIFAIAALTDFLDGYLARKYNLISDFGKLMDPIADKFLILAAFFIFTQLSIMPFWMFVVIALREILITAIRIKASRKGHVLAAEKSGKLKTIIQMVTIIFALIFLVLMETSYLSGDPTVGMWCKSIYSLMIMSVVITLYSGVSFLWNNRKNELI